MSSTLSKDNPLTPKYLNNSFLSSLIKEIKPRTVNGKELVSPKHHLLDVAETIVEKIRPEDEKNKYMFKSRVLKYGFLDIMPKRLSVYAAYADYRMPGLIRIVSVAFEMRGLEFQCRFWYDDAESEFLYSPNFATTPGKLHYTDYYVILLNEYVFESA